MEARETDAAYGRAQEGRTRVRVLTVRVAVQGVRGIGRLLFEQLRTASVVGHLNLIGIMC
jgi:hypothetical protein